ncbi:uncharacterized protein [Diabrotica undecimpunctata]|uniref:uncharacterized protein n=1 Tax=Diabrotica undecimpunctata TaxID=50387 RepID=UPI003B636276
MEKQDEVSITKVSVKKENLNDDIKEFAQNAMNELLGWYGYDNPRDDLKIQKNCRTSHSGSSSSGISPKPSDGCGWCGKSIDDNTAISSGASVFCSELCFSQSRRANFKKNKTCDWCRHVRHTISYVDFQDGASQLQFCSDKCLNQYKMYIFCRETRAHLDLHPHLRIEENTSGTLITPDLWLKNCKSPEMRSPSPEISPKPPEKSPQTSPIVLTHTSKLIENSESKRNRMKAQKRTRKRIPATITGTVNTDTNDSFLKSPPDDMPQDLRVRHTPTDFENKDSERDTIPPFKPIKLPIEPRIPSPPNPDTESTQGPPPNTLRKPFESLLPPPTLIVPYPIILPIPIPIPIPIPLPIKKEEKKEVERTEASSQTEAEVEKTVEVNGHDTNCKDEPKVLERPLRKRNRPCDVKERMTLKPKKQILSSN